MRDDDRQLRPDLIVRLPGGKQVVVDAKAPLQSFLDAYEATDEHQRDAHLAVARPAAARARAQAVGQELLVAVRPTRRTSCCCSCPASTS